jgi:hypothetical protein
MRIREPQPVGLGPGPGHRPRASACPRAARVLELQRSVGNRATTRLLLRQPLVDFESGDWRDAGGNLVDPGQRNQPTMSNAEIQALQRDGVPFDLSERFLRGIGVTKRAGNQWQRNFNDRGDHISMRALGSRLAGATARDSMYYYTFSSFRVTFVTPAGNIQYHWVHLGTGVWKQAGHTRNDLIRQWNENPGTLEELARRVAYDFIHQDLQDADDIDVAQAPSLI